MLLLNAACLKRAYHHAITQYKAVVRPKFHFYDQGYFQITKGEIDCLMKSAREKEIAEDNVALKRTINRLIVLSKAVHNHMLYKQNGAFCSVIINDVLNLMQTQLLPKYFSAENNLSTESLVQEEKEDFKCIDFATLLSISGRLNIALSQRTEASFHAYVHVIGQRDAFQTALCSRATSQCQAYMHEHVERGGSSFTWMAGYVHYMQAVTVDAKQLKRLVSMHPILMESYEVGFKMGIDAIELQDIELVVVLCTKIILRDAPTDTSKLILEQYLTSSHCLELHTHNPMLTNQKLYILARATPPPTIIKQQLHILEFYHWTDTEVITAMEIAIPFIKAGDQLVSKLISRYLKRLGGKIMKEGVVPIIRWLNWFQRVHHYVVDSQRFIQVNTATCNWLCAHSDQQLLTGSHQDLCRVMDYCERHQALKDIFLPYLQRLIKLSFGRFRWQEMNKIYYYGLRWNHSFSYYLYLGEKGELQETEQNLEYVRRYILNEYAAMGSARRDIPLESYFYRILEQTTSEVFFATCFNRK